MSLFITGFGAFLLLAGVFALVFLIAVRLFSGSKIKMSGLPFFFLLFIAIGCMVLAVGAFLEYHEQPEFCGELCHAMDPHYLAYNEPLNNTFIGVHSSEHVTCVDCHSGPGTVGFVESFYAVPRETYGELTGDYDHEHIGGHVAVENCMKCHEDVDWAFEAPVERGSPYDVVNGSTVWLTRTVWHPYTENGTDTSGLYELESCTECHDPRSNGFGIGAEACLVCHDLTHEELESHGNVTCDLSPCHRDAQGNPVQPPKTGHRDVEDHCTLCHDRAHSDDASVPYSMTFSTGVFTANNTFCGSCHEEPAEILHMSGGLHEEQVECIECHQNHKDYPVCQSCHEEGAVPHPTAGTYAECSDCHIRGGHAPRNITFILQSSPQVSTDFCGASSCHQDNVYQNTMMNRSGLLHTRDTFDEDCLACHEDHSAEVDCLDCHTPSHEITDSYSDCSLCHGDGHAPDEISFIDYNAQFTMDSSFCGGCHQQQNLDLSDTTSGHVGQECIDCHGEHQDYEDCVSCHSDTGIAPTPVHLTSAPYDDCVACHENGHLPGEVVFTNIYPTSTTFCGGCHGDTPSDPVPMFETYGGAHNELFSTCTHSCHEDHETSLSCTESLCHSGGLLPTDHTSLTGDDCILCHDSAHNPVNAAPSPGQELSQRSYMTEYYALSTTDMSSSFSWQPRGSHDLYDNCSECHDSIGNTNYPLIAQPFINTAATNCASGCHNWTNNAWTSTPYDLLAASNTSHYHLIFNNATNGGCAGYCHQTDPLSPVYSGSGHGTINNCMDGSCHGGQFFGGEDLHDDHTAYLDDTGVDCYTVCHMPGKNFGAPIDGGCYDCHKSGHDPALTSTSVCYGACHT